MSKMACTILQLLATSRISLHLRKDSNRGGAAFPENWAKLIAD